MEKKAWSSSFLAQTGNVRDQAETLRNLMNNSPTKQATPVIGIFGEQQIKAPFLRLLSMTLSNSNINTLLDENWCHGEDRPSKPDLLLVNADFNFSDFIFKNSQIMTSTDTNRSQLSDFILLVDPDKSSLSLAFEQLCQLRSHFYASEVGIIVNRVTNGEESRRAYTKLVDLTSQLDIQIFYFGHLPRNDFFIRDVLKGKSLINSRKRLFSSQVEPCLGLLAKRFITRYMDA